MPSTFTAVVEPIILFGNSTAIDKVFAPSKVSTPGLLKPELSAIDGAMTSLNRKKSKKKGSCLGPAKSETPLAVVSTIAVDDEISTSPRGESTSTSLFKPVWEGVAGPKKYIRPSLGMA